MNGPFSKGIFPALDDLINKLFWNRMFVKNGSMDTITFSKKK